MKCLTIVRRDKFYVRFLIRSLRPSVQAHNVKSRKASTLISSNTPCYNHQQFFCFTCCGFHIPNAKRTFSTDAVPTSEDLASIQQSGEGLGGLKRKTEILETKVKAVLSIFDLQAQRARLAELEHEAGDSNLWNDSESAQNVLVQLNSLRSEIDEIMGFQSKVEEAQFAIEFLESDESMRMSEVSSIISDSLSILSQLEIALERWEVKRLLSGPYDVCGARLSITAGAGGVDAMDWAAMLERMYLRWSEQSGYVTRMVERQVGDEAGLKGVEMEVEGRYAYGFLKGEKGTHRLVRNSPFNSKGLRQTSFAGVEVMPILTESQALPVAAKLQIPEKDLEISFMRAGGKGGQNVNKVETGVRIVHVPTGLAVKCTQERSQLQNRAIAMDQLRAKLLVVLEEQQAMQVAEIRGDVVKAEWGQQIRNYVLHPYKLVKDTRTGEETADVQSVLDGAAPLSNFITAHLRLKASGLSCDATT